ncbi:hypothetical protein [Microcystis phage Mae-JY22]
MQLHLDFEPGLTERYPSLMEVVRAQVYGCGKALKAVAADADMSQSELSRKLGDNPNDPRRLTVEDLEKLIVATDSVMVVHWLIERFLQSDDTRRERALNELQKQLPQFMALMTAALKDGK